jgi:two-component system chemotaxis response regulator CheY
MPRMNGIELVGLIKVQPANANLTIVMLTTEGQPELIEKAKAAGARGWMVKPFKPDQLLATVRRYAGAG